MKGYAVNPAANTFTPIAGAVINNVTSVTMDGSGSFVYISSISNLFTFRVNPATGALTQLSHTNAPASDDANDVVVVP